MKRLFSMKKGLLLLIVLVFSSSAAADTNLSSLSYNELVALNNQLTAEIMSRPEWKEITVPAGQWTIGVDIPAGTYSLTPASFAGVTIWRKKIDDYSNDGLVFNKALDPGESYGKIQLETGWIVVLSKPVTFAPPVLFGF